jgi:hypothetical protein
MNVTAKINSVLWSLDIPYTLWGIVQWALEVLWLHSWLLQSLACQSLNSEVLWPSLQLCEAAYTGYPDSKRRHSCDCMGQMHDKISPYNLELWILQHTIRTFGNHRWGICCLNTCTAGWYRQAHKDQSSGCATKLCMPSFSMTLCGMNHRIFKACTSSSISKQVMFHCVFEVFLPQMARGIWFVYCLLDVHEQNSSTQVAISHPCTCFHCDCLKTILTPLCYQ